MGEAIIIVAYIFFCLLVGLCGSQRRMGFFGTFIVSLFLTPVIMLLILVFTAPPRGAAASSAGQLRAAAAGLTAALPGHSDWCRAQV